MSEYESMADRDEALALSRAAPHHAWVLTDRDVWHRNPFYHGPEMPHPEDDGAHDFIADHGIDAWREATEAARAAAIAAAEAKAREIADAPDPWWPDDPTP
ncbi:hypothetical protein [Komagataeibacter xylinus]|uniref:hypothetical protein n=1 Tax=Komagataeibacter xylinus TaxID=28448 RepID=UPI000FDF8769|nr:hypothetical protein [Komagataeibacter xylinus]AZV40700.1 hypothetical protein CXP35_17680 [Komagataeibacter xylinus]